MMQPTSRLLSLALTRCCRTLCCIMVTTAWMLAAPSLHAAEQTVHIYSWVKYVPDDILAAFTQNTGIKIKYHELESLEKLYAEMKAGSKAYDVVFPSADYVSQMGKEGLLMPLVQKKMPHFPLIMANFRNKPYDPGNRYSVPYTWGSTSIVFNSKQVQKDVIKGLADLWKPEFKGKLVVVDDPRGVMAIVLRMLGYSVNEENPERIRKAYEKLMTLAPKVKLITTEEQIDALSSGTVTAGVVFSGDAYEAEQRGAPIEYIYPKEGFVLWVDNMSIPKNAPNPELAYQFIDYILRPENAAKISTVSGYPVYNVDGLMRLESKFRNNPKVYPPYEQVRQGEYINMVNPAALALYNKYYQAFKDAVNKSAATH